jgi:hypothetical protein
MTKRDEADSYKNFSGKSKQYIRDVAKDLVKWSDSYGMSNDLELWATGVEDFLKLPRYHRQKIIQLKRILMFVDITSRLPCNNVMFIFR